MKIINKNPLIVDVCINIPQSGEYKFYAKPSNEYALLLIEDGTFELGLNKTGHVMINGKSIYHSSELFKILQKYTLSFKSTQITENAKKAVKARWNKTTSKQRKDVSDRLHKAKAEKKLTELKKRGKTSK